MKKNIIIFIFSLVSLFRSAPLRAQESCYEQYLREHNMSFLTAEAADDSYEELKKEVLARQAMRKDALFHPLMLAVDTISGTCHLLAQDGSLIADVHLALVDSTWYMWLSVDPLADKYPGNTPYMYCNGNPIMLIDPYGEEPSTEEAAAMAAYAYGDIDLSVEDDNTKAFKKQLGDWNLIDTHTGLAGYQAALFEREIDGVKEYTYAFAGTDRNSFADMVTDWAQAMDFPSQYEIAITYARAIALKYFGAEVTFVGHSLGGGEATAAAMATGKTAITFNPAAISHATRNRNMLLFPAKIKNNVVSGDPVTSVQMLGNIPLVNLLKKSGLIILPGQTNIVPQTAGDAHTIYNFIK